MILHQIHVYFDLKKPLSDEDAELVSQAALTGALAKLNQMGKSDLVDHMTTWQGHEERD
jgi:hypothetical protein